MYTASLTINSKTLALDMSHGYVVSTINGLTGVSGRLNTIPNSATIGEAYVDGTVGGLPLTVSGYILDNNFTAKENLINTVVPLGTGTFTIYDQAAGDERPVAYRTIDVVVQQTPTVTQERHAKFSFQLYAPFPAWREQTAETETAGAGQGYSFTVKGQTNAEFVFTLTPASGTPVKEFYVQIDSSKLFAVDMQKYNAAGVSTPITVTINKGSVKVVTNSIDVTKCFYPQSTFLSLPAGAHTITITGVGTATATSSISYYPSYVGVILHC